MADHYERTAQRAVCCCSFVLSSQDDWKEDLQDIDAWEIKTRLPISALYHAEIVHSDEGSYTKLDLLASAVEAEQARAQGLAPLLTSGSSPTVNRDVLRRKQRRAHGEARP